MPNTKSAVRRVRRVKKQTIVNRIRKSKYKNAIKHMGLKEDLREIKNNNEFVTKREEILSMIWDMEEEIMGKEN